jgi:hypothetical protein
VSHQYIRFPQRAARGIEKRVRLGLVQYQITYQH